MRSIKLGNLLISGLCSASLICSAGCALADSSATDKTMPSSAITVEQAAPASVESGADGLIGDGVNGLGSEGIGGDAVVSSQYATATADMDLSYSKRDLSADYDESTSTVVTFEDDGAQVDGEGAACADGVLTISQEGTYILKGEFTGQVLVDCAEDAKVQLVLDGVTIRNDDGPAICALEADKLFITLADGSANVLADGASYDLAEGEDEPFATVYAKMDLTLNGSGSLEVEGNYRHAVVSKDDLVVTGGSYHITAVEDALRGRDGVLICDGDFDLSAGEDAIKSNNDEELETRGFVIIDGGTFRIEAGDDALHAESVMAINDGVIDISSCYEGIEGQQVFINGGAIHLTASDDGMNAATPGGSSMMGGRGMGMPGSGTTDLGTGGRDAGASGMASTGCLIEINGGYTVVYADGDGVDSNGDLTFNGGVLLVCGPESSADSALDYDGTATLNGGTIIAVGSVGMAQGFGSSASQASINAQVNGSAGTAVALTASNGEVIASFTPGKSFQLVQVTAPGLVDGGEYALTVGGTVDGANEDGFASAGGACTVDGGTSTTVTASLDSTSSGGMGGFGGGMGGHGGMGGGFGGDMTSPTDPGSAGDMTSPTKPGSAGDMGAGRGEMGGFGGPEGRGGAFDPATVGGQPGMDAPAMSDGAGAAGSQAGSFDPATAGDQSGMPGAFAPTAGDQSAMSGAPTAGDKSLPTTTV